jgi:reversibly glycosylated polypeptide / UDP-arabinopyranose mutase
VTFTVVVPTIREDCAVKWVQEWKEDLRDARVIIIEDNPEPTFNLPGVEHYAWRDIDAELKQDSWIIPRRTSACRSYGFLKALQGDADIIWTTDDDCYPEEGRKGQYFSQFRENFSTDVTSDDVMNGWWNTISGSGLYPRCYPYDIRGTPRPVMVHHGLWSNIPDLDGITQLANPDFRLQPCNAVDVVPEKAFFPFCIMNVAFRREAAPLLYMLLMGKDKDGTPWGFDRFDDIWGGVMMKKVADHLGWAVTSGSPSVHHSRASDPHRNVELEAAGIPAHESFWKLIEAVSLTKDNAADCYRELADTVRDFRHPSERPYYWRSLAESMHAWADLTEDA